MPAYHSAISTQGVKRLGNVAVLPIKCSVRGPGTCLPKDSPQADVIDEALAYFKANVFFRTYEIKSDADRVLIYLTLYIQDCLKKLQRCSSKTQGKKKSRTLFILRLHNTELIHFSELFMENFFDEFYHEKVVKRSIHFITLHFDEYFKVFNFDFFRVL